MQIWEAVFLGIVQGLTEFLPVSSSGHLVIAQRLLGVEAPGISFEILVHVGTLVAVLWVFWKDIIRLDRKLITLLIVGSIPAGLLGAAFKDFFTTLFQSVGIVSITLIITGAILWFTDRIPAGEKSIQTMGHWDAFWVGCGQALAILPGISRSGSTIATALVLKMERAQAARFSFLLSIPVILGATILEIPEFAASVGAVGILPLLVGSVLAALSGVVAIRVLLRLIQERSLRYFAYYVWALALVVGLFLR